MINGHWFTSNFRRGGWDERTIKIFQKSLHSIINKNYKLQVPTKKTQETSFNLYNKNCTTFHHHCKNTNLLDLDYQKCQIHTAKTNINNQKKNPNSPKLQIPHIKHPECNRSGTFQPHLPAHPATPPKPATNSPKIQSLLQKSQP